MSDEGEDELPGEATASSAISASSTGGDDPLEGEEDLVKRRSKNRVNARRSRERKRLMLDTLQQEHWQLHQENKRMKMDNEKLREAIDTVKSLQGAGSLPSRGDSSGAGSATLQNLGNLFQNGNPTRTSDSTNNGSSNGNLGASNDSAGASGNNNSAAVSPSSTGNPLMDFLAQQLMQQQQQQQQQAPQTSNNLNLAQLAMGCGFVGLGGMNPMFTQLLLANSLQQQQQQQQGSGGFNQGNTAMINPSLLALIQQQQFGQQQHQQHQQQQQQFGQQQQQPQQSSFSTGAPLQQQSTAVANAPAMSDPAPDRNASAPAPVNNMENGDDASGGGNANVNHNSGPAPAQNLAGLIQSLGGGGGNNNALNQDALMNANPAGLMSLLQALGGRQQAPAPVPNVVSGGTNNGNSSSDPSSMSADGTNQRNKSNQDGSSRCTNV